MIKKRLSKSFLLPNHFFVNFGKSHHKSHVLKMDTGLQLKTYLADIDYRIFGICLVSIINIEKVAAALNVSIEYLFSSVRFSPNLAYLKKDFEVPFITCTVKIKKWSARYINFSILTEMTNKTNAINRW